MRFLRENSLSVFFFVLFAGAVVAQSAAGQRVFNQEQLEQGGQTVSWARYLVTSHFGRALLENWQSEFLQFTLFIVVTVWLVQKGSNESKKLGEAGLETDERQRVGAYADDRSPRWARVRGWRLRLYENSLLVVMLTIFLASWFVQSLTGWSEQNDEQRAHSEPTMSWLDYLVRAEFWEDTLQNWQSEFLAVGTMAVFTIYLRQRGSPESKPVGAPHDETGSSG